jgi:hypothetical protein
MWQRRDGMGILKAVIDGNNNNDDDDIYLYKLQTSVGKNL